MGVRDRVSARIRLGKTAKWLLQYRSTSAAALSESLSQNHPFVDGNKRVAVPVAAAFLRVNGYRLEFDDMSPFHFSLVGTKPAL